MRKLMVASFISLVGCSNGTPIDINSVVYNDTTNWSVVIGHSCNADGLLFQGLDMSDGAYQSIMDSSCLRVARAVELWNAVPNYEVIHDNLLRFASRTNKRFMFGAFYAESMSTLFLDSSFCQPGTTDYWGPHTCVPDSTNQGFRTYILQTTSKLIDAGIRDFEFGQLAFIDPTEQIGQLVDAMRVVALSKGVNIIIGAQPNKIPTDNYLLTFDYILGPMHIATDGTFNESSAGGMDYAPDVWGTAWQGKAKHIFVETDWYSTDDDIHRLLALPNKQQSLKLINDYMYANGMGLILPFVVPLTNADYSSYTYGDDYSWNQLMENNK